MKDADAFYQRLSRRMERRYLVDASQTEKERQRLEARNQEIDGMFLSLYTDKAKGILTERYATIEELDEAVLNRLISRILIGEVKKVDGQKVQEVRIVYNFVGEIPEIAA